jgi:hypothetical protein
MKPNNILMVLLFITINQVYSEALALGYEKDRGNNNRIRLFTLVGLNSGKQYMNLVDVLPINWITEDNYNQNKWNYSLSTLIQPFLTLPYLTLQDTNKNKLSFQKALYWISMLNSEHHYFPFKFGNLYNANKDKQVSLSIYAKNDIDMFLFRENKWISLSPGGGIGISYIKWSSISAFILVRIGANYVVDIEQGNINKEWKFNFSIVFSGD